MIPRCNILHLLSSPLSLKALLFIFCLSLLKAKCPLTHMENVHFNAQTLLVPKRAYAHVHWIFNLCPIFLPFWSSAMTAAFTRRQAFSRFSTMGGEITLKHTHTQLWHAIGGRPPIAPFPPMTVQFTSYPSSPDPAHQSHSTGSTHHYSGCLEAQGAPA